jgi:hypothetical protein
MELSRTVACAALLLVVLLSAGHALGHGLDRIGMQTAPTTCTIKPVMTDAEIEICKIQYRRGR